MSTERIATLKRGRGGVDYQQKRCFLKLRMDADRMRLFGSNVSRLLSMIVGPRSYRVEMASGGEHFWNFQISRLKGQPREVEGNFQSEFPKTFSV